jgi:hypothetical protein
MQKFGTVVLFTSAVIILAGCTNLPGAANSTPTPTANNNSGSDTSINSATTTINPNGDPKSADWPSDVPTPAGAADFTYVYMNGTYALGFKVPLNGKTLNDIVADIISLQQTKGWTMQRDSSFQSDNGITESFTKGAKTQTAIATREGPADPVVSVTIQVAASGN